MPRALILGGTGLIGGAAARRLRQAGWTVDAPGREVDREDPAAMAAALGDGADLLVDCLCYTAAHGRTLLPLARHVATSLAASAVEVPHADHARSIAEPAARSVTAAPAMAEPAGRDASAGCPAPGRPAAAAAPELPDDGERAC